MTTQPTQNLQRVRYAVRGVLVLGMAASVAANVLHADPNLISKVIAAWPPIALLLAIELVIHVPVHRLAITRLRRAGTLLIAGIAAYVSYWHMAGVAVRYGESGLSVFLLPVSVDGLIAVASICLVEITGRLRDEDTAPALAMDIQKATVDAKAIEPAPDVEVAWNGHDRLQSVPDTPPAKPSVAELVRDAMVLHGTDRPAVSQMVRDIDPDVNPETLRGTIYREFAKINGHRVASDA